jgi:hypothetical protein
MDERVSLVPKFLPQDRVISLANYNNEDLAYYVIRALEKCYCFYDSAPDFYDIWDNFIDEIHMVEWPEFYIDGLIIHRARIDEMTLDYLLSEMKVEYTDFRGEVHNQAQNIVMGEWL